MMALLISGTTHLRAEERLGVSAQIDKLISECIAKGDHPTGCVSDKERELGDELARTYKKVLALAGKNPSMLREAQRNWLKYQDSNCNFHWRYWMKDGETAAYGSKAICLLRTTMQRLDEVASFIEERQQ
jgi:uncharacterized protein YecT (DUF1311 family)